MRGRGSIRGRGIVRAYSFVGLWYKGIKEMSDFLFGLKGYAVTTALTAVICSIPAFSSCKRANTAEREYNACSGDLERLRVQVAECNAAIAIAQAQVTGLSDTLTEAADVEEKRIELDAMWQKSDVSAAVDSDGACADWFNTPVPERLRDALRSSK